MTLPQANSTRNRTASVMQAGFVAAVIGHILVRNATLR